MSWIKICNVCGCSPIVEYYDDKIHSMTSLCSRCQGRNTSIIRSLEQRRKIESAYFEKLCYNRAIEEYVNN